MYVCMYVCIRSSVDLHYLTCNSTIIRVHAILCFHKQYINITSQLVLA